MLRYLFVCFFVLCSASWAWHDDGHKLVAEIAWRRLSGPTQQRVTEILSRHPDPEVRTLAESAVWPDDIRLNYHPFHQFHQPNWHYQDNPILPSEQELEFDLDLGGQLIEQLERQTSILSDPTRSDSDRAVAMSWLVHLVGDIHQPLHNSELYNQQFPNGDRGGNLFDVVLGQETLSLHFLWDSGGGRFMVKLSPERLRSYRRWFELTHPVSQFKENLEETSFAAWSEEGLQLARQAYEGVEPNEVVSEEALQSALDVSRTQITLAGYRLGSLLERALAP